MFSSRASELTADHDLGDTRMSQEPYPGRDRHDAALLRELGLARKPGRENPLRERHVQAELLASYRPWIYRIVSRRLRGRPNRYETAEDITQEIFHELARRLAETHQFPKAFRRVVLDYIDWRVADYLKSPSHKHESEVSDPETIAETVAAPAQLPSEETQAADFAARLEGLNDRDRRIAIERFYNGRSPSEIAEMLGITPNACHQACHRVAQRIAASAAMADVRQELEGSNR